MFDVTDWNVEPNQKWYVKLSDAGAQALVELFNSLEDLEASVDQVGAATVGFGVDVKVILTPGAAAPAAGDALALFNTALDYHLKISGADGDSTKRYAIGPFTDLPAIEDPLILTEDMIRARGELEINRGTHAHIYSSLTPSRHYPALDEGTVVTLSSTRRGFAGVRQKIVSITTEIRIDESKQVTFADQLETVEYLDFVRQ